MSKKTTQYADAKVRPSGPAWLEWVACSAPFAMGHFCLLSILSLLFAYHAPWVLTPFALFAEVAEAGLMATSNYRGEDSLQWPIIIANSWLYGFGIYWLYRRLRRSRPTC